MAARLAAQETLQTTFNRAENGQVLNGTGLVHKAKAFVFTTDRLN